MATLPPWLNIQPSDYLQAAHSGAQLGMQIAAAQNRAQEAAAERDMQLRHQAQRQWEFQENLRQRASELAASREEAAARLEEANRYHLASIAEAQAGHAAQAEQYAAQRENYKRMAEAAAVKAKSPLHVGTSLVDPETFKTLYTAPSTAKTPLTIGESELAHATAKQRIENELDPLRKEIAGMSPTTHTGMLWWKGPEKPNPEYSAATNKLAKLEASIGGIGGRTPAAVEPTRTLDTFGTPYPPAPSEGTTKPRNEVVRMTKDGKRAVFDSDTKEFLRYAE